MSLSKPTPCLSGMPLLIKQQIVLQTDLSTRMSLRRCSKEFHKLSETLKIQYHDVCFHLWKNAIKLELTKRSLPFACYYRRVEREEKDLFRTEYQNNGGNCIVQGRIRNETVIGKNYLKLAVTELMKILKNPKAHLESLSIFPSWSNMPDNDARVRLMSLITDEFSLLPKGSLKVKNFEVGYALYPDGMKTMLEPLKPGYLKTLLLESNHGRRRMNEVMELEQWKQLEDLTVSNWENAPVQRLVGFREVQLEGLHEVLSVEELNALIKGILHHHETFERFFMHFGWGADVPIDPQLLQEIKNATGNEEDVKFVKIPKTNFSLKIYLSSCTPFSTDNALNIEKIVSES